MEEPRSSRVTVRVRYALRPFTNGAAQIAVEALTLRHGLSAIDQSYPGLCARVLTPEGEKPERFSGPARPLPCENP